MRSRGAGPIFLIILVLGADGLPIARAQDTAALTERPQIYVDYVALLRKELSLFESPAPTRTPRLQMFRMPSGFLANPLGLISEDDPSLEDPFSKTDDDLRFLQVTLGNHVPYLDMYRRGDPGGFGYYQIYSQVQLVDAGATNVSVAMNAVTPMGVQCGGVGSGRTVLSPALACFHDLGDGAAIHAFVGQHIASSTRLREQFHTGFRCGLAVQHPLPLTECNVDQGLFLFVQALGQYRVDSPRSDVRATAWEVIPGVQYRLNNACWMSLGLSRYHFLAATWSY